MTRTQILNWLIARFGYASYLEIGIGDGGNFSAIRCPSKTAVDPGGCSGVAVDFRVTSDAFFAGNTRKFDLIFIDGLHHAEVVGRDLRNALHALHPGGMVVCHDLNPTSEAMQRVPREQAEWTGDGWRAWLGLRAERSDLAMAVLETDYGVGIVYTGAKVKSPRLRLRGGDISYARFERNKRAWLPLIQPEDLAGWLGLPGVTGSVCEADWIARLPTLSPAERPFLLYCPTDAGNHLADFLGDDRMYDVALNDFSGRGKGMDGAEWRFAEKGHKWPCIARNLPKIDRAYAYYAFFDNDIEIDPQGINTLFLTGHALGLQLFQAALTRDSCASHDRLRRRAGSLVRATDFVEVMMPVFSQSALGRCAHTFGDSESGWGLDHVWPLYLGDGSGMAVVDAVPARHARAIRSRQWVLSNGLTPEEELRAVVAKHGAILADRVFGRMTEGGANQMPSTHLSSTPGLVNRREFPESGRIRDSQEHR